MTVARHEKHMLHLRIFENFDSHNFHRETDIYDYTIDSFELIIDRLFTVIYHSFDLNDCIHFFSNFDYCFQMKAFFVERRDVTTQIDDTFFSNVDRFVSKKLK